MNKSARTLILILGALLFALLLVWGGSVIYWHFEIRSAIRSLEDGLQGEIRGTGNSIEQQLAERTLCDAGCRSLPALVACMDETRDPLLLSLESYLIAWISVHPGIRLSEADGYPVADRLNRWHVLSSDPPYRIREKCVRIREWWIQEGPEQHRFWKTWTNDCRGVRPR